MINRTSAVSLKALTHLVLERFWEKVQRADGDGCWEWTGSIGDDGYGMFHISALTIGAHRVAVELDGRDIPDGFVVLHRCDNRRCVRPSHLEVGTQQANMEDMVTKGRNRNTRQGGYRRIYSAHSRTLMLDVENYDYLCTCAVRDRFSVNRGLNQLLRHIESTGMTIREYTDSNLVPV